VPNSLNLKIPDDGGRHLEFWEYVNNFGLDKDKFGGEMYHGHAEITT